MLAVINFRLIVFGFVEIRMIYLNKSNLTHCPGLLLNKVLFFLIAPHTDEALARNLNI